MNVGRIIRNVGCMRNANQQTRFRTSEISGLWNRRLGRGKNESSEHHFSSAAYLNSPDPSMIPIPIFDNEADHVNPARKLSTEKSGSSLTKTDTLRDFLNIRSRVGAI